MNKSEHEMLIHGTLSRRGVGGGEHVNKTTVLRAVSSVNVTPLYLDEPICIVGKGELPAQPDSHVGTEAVELVRGVNRI